MKREGNIAALLELASGFDGDLTVRENAYLRGAMLGYTRKFMDEMYGEIIEFAELGGFQDRPFKQLSSGMKSRLAFSIASLVEPDILILDEVLSVGDGAFRKKSEAKMQEIISGGATTILVSHSIEQIQKMCSKVLWLDRGAQVEFGGDVQDICDRYQDFLKTGTLINKSKKLPAKQEEREITSFEECWRVNNNCVLVDPKKSKLLHSSKIEFYGKNNILYIEDGVNLDKSKVTFLGNNSVVYLSGSSHPYHVDICVFQNSAVYVGKNCYMNPAGIVQMIAAERQNIIIGEDGLISYGICIRTTDPHLIYSCECMARLNQSKSVIIGDHVWIGQEALILKGTRIGSGSIVAGHACVAGKTVKSNTAIAGNPAKTIREKVFFLSSCVNGWTEEDTKAYEKRETREYIYSMSEDNASMQELDVMLKDAADAEARLNVIISLLVENKCKNRFAIAEEASEECR